MQPTNYVAGLRSGDPAAMKIIMKNTKYRLIGRAMRYVDDMDEIEDILMNAYKELWIKRDKIYSNYQMNALLFVAVRSACLNYQKKMQHKTTYERHQVYSNKFQEASPAEKLEIEDLLEYVFSHFDELEPRCRDVLRLTYIDKLNDVEIALRLNMKIKSVQSKRSRGIAMLKQILNDKGAGPQIMSILLLLSLLPETISGTWHIN